jgi:hypothetical protein
MLGGAMMYILCLFYMSDAYFDFYYVDQSEIINIY